MPYSAEPSRNLTDLIESHHRAMLDDPHPDGTALHAKMLALLTARQAKQHMAGARAGSSPDRPDTGQGIPFASAPPAAPDGLLALLAGQQMVPDGGQDPLAGLLGRLGPRGNGGYRLPSGGFRGVGTDFGGDPAASLYETLAR